MKHQMQYRKPEICGANTGHPPTSGQLPNGFEDT
jgi:hypothetical protein